ncbi:MAG TPA: RDD family protein [Thermoplasmata archaeon]|jgi:uncharacterized RDD family membrane protein YckC|nr:RDD family protein [Thermoplasmata archaeon]
MVDLGPLALEASADAITLALPGLLWGAWFLLAFEHDAFAESVGLGRRAFWLLLPGSLLASLAFVPIAPISNDWLAISLGGAGFPLIVGGLAVERFAPPVRRSLVLVGVALAGLATILLVLVLPATAALAGAVGAAVGAGLGAGQDLLVLAGAVAGVVAFALFVRGPSARPLAVLVAATAGVLVATFAASAAIPGVGIEESFPTYLFPPLGAGIAVAAVGEWTFPGRPALALPVAYLAATLGVLIGADVLRQPPLYGSGPGGLYAIGGAGILDLVYLSGLLALGGALGTYRLLGGTFVPVAPAPPEAPAAPTTRLFRAFREGVEGDVPASLADSAAASRAAALQARRLLGIPPPTDDRPWAGLPVPGWVVSDDANLAAAAREGSSDGAEGYRGWLTARWMVVIGRDLGASRFASIARRAAAYGIDLVVLGLPAVAVWSAIILLTPGGLDDVVASVPFSAAAFGFGAIALLYFALGETVYGTTVGKAVLGLAVRARTLERPSGLSALLRNVPLLPGLTVIGIGLPVALAFLVKGAGAAGASVLGIPLPSGVLAFGLTLGFVVAGVLFLGVIGVLAMVVSGERQRLGDYLAGTWVIRAEPPARPPAGAEAAPSG